MNTKIPLYRGMTRDKTVKGIPKQIFRSLCTTGIMAVVMLDNFYMLIPVLIIYFILKEINKKDDKILENFLRKSLKKYISY